MKPKIGDLIHYMNSFVLVKEDDIYGGFFIVKHLNSGNEVSCNFRSPTGNPKIILSLND